MTPRSLFNIILKIFGLFFLREIINTVPQLFSSLAYFAKVDYPMESIWTLIISILIIALYVVLVLQLLFRTNSIIDKLRLEQGFDEHEFSFAKQDKFSINISTTLVLTIALIVIGGVILAEEIPNFCRNVFLFTQEERISRGMQNSNSSYIITTAVKIIMGLLILGERKRIIEFIESSQQDKNVSEE